MEEFVVALDPSSSKLKFWIAHPQEKRNYYMLALVWLIMVEKSEHGTVKGLYEGTEK